MKITTLLQTTRPPFLILTLACVFLGFSTSFSIQPSIDLWMAFLVLAGAVLAHIAVNTLNEYYDFKSGLDLKTEKTPFSGGSGALPKHPEAAGATLITGLISLMLVVLIGIYFILERGIPILPIGLIGILLIISYTPWINRSPLLCLLAPGTGFGILMVIGTHLVLTGEVSKSVWLVSLIPFFLTNNLLLLNQYPDIKADASAGRKTFPIAYGISNSNIVYALFITAPCLLILLLVVTATIPLPGVIALMSLLFAIVSLNGAIKHLSQIGEHPKYLASNVAAAVLTPLLLGVVIISS